MFNQKNQNEKEPETISQKITSKVVTNFIKDNKKEIILILGAIIGISVITSTTISALTKKSGIVVIKV